MRGVRLALLTCLATLGVVAFAFAGETSPDLQGAKKPDGPYTSDVLMVGVEGKRDLYVKAVSNADVAEHWYLKEAVGGPGAGDYKFRWFKGTKEITDEVEDAGHEFKLRAHKSRRFRVQVKVTAAGPPEDACLDPGIHPGPMLAAADRVFFALNAQAGTCE